MDLPPLAVLIIEDNPGDARLIEEMLAKQPFEISKAETLKEGLDQLKTTHFDVILLDLSLPDASGLDGYKKVHKAVRDRPVIVFTGLDDEKLAIEAVSKGAQDYLVKGHVDTHLLTRAIRYANERQRLVDALSLASLIVDRAPEPAFWVGRDGNLIYVNEAACNSLGYEETDLLTKTVHEIIPELDAESWEAHWDELKSKGMMTVEAPFKTSDGRQLPMEIRIKYLKHKGREYHCVFARYPTHWSLIKAVPDLICRLNKAGELQEFMVPRKFGLPMPLGPFLGKNIFDLLDQERAEVISPDLVKRARKAVKKVASEQKPELLTYEVADSKLETLIVPTGEDDLLMITRNLSLLEI